MSLFDSIRNLLGINKTPQVDPELEKMLMERGQESKLEELKKTPGTQTGPIVFEVGQGLTAQQKNKAEETIKKQTALAQKEKEFAKSQTPIAGPVSSLPGIQRINKITGIMEKQRSNVPVTPEEQKELSLAFIDIGSMAGTLKPIKQILESKIVQNIKETGSDLVKKAMDEVLPPVNPNEGIELIKNGKVYADNIRLERLASTDDVSNLVKDVSNRMKIGINDQKRGIMTQEKTKELADNLGLEVDDFIKTKKGTAFNAEEIVASNDLLRKTSEEVIELQKKILEGDNSTTTLLKFKDSLEKQSEVQRVLAGGIAESGRALQANKILARQIPDDLKIQKKMLDSLGGEKITQELAERMAKIPPGDLLAVNKFIRDVTKTPLGDKVYEFWINSILSNPVSHLRNVFGNAYMSLKAPFERSIQAGLEATKGSGRQVYFSEVPAQVVGSLKGLSEGVRKALFVFRNGISEGQVSKIDNIRPDAIKGKFGTAVRLPTRALSAADEFFKSVNRTSEIYAKAMNQAIKEGKTGKSIIDRASELIANPSRQMMESIESYVDETVFQKDLGELGNTILGLRNKVPGLKYLIPFIKTPTNILKEAVKSTPLGVGSVINKAVKQGISSPEVTKDLSKTLLGSMITVPIAMKVLEGEVTGSAPTNSAERDAFYRAGKQPYAIKIGNEWISYRGIEPIATVAGLTADIVEQIKEGKEVDDQVMSVAALIGKNLLDKSYMNALSDFLNAIEDPARFGSNFVAYTLSGFVPSALSPVAAQGDAVMRETKGDTFIETVKNKIKAKIPGLREELLPKRNVFGEPVKRAKYPFIPFSATAATQDPTDQELDRLDITVGFPSKNQLGATMSVEQYDQYLEASGSLIKTALDGVMGSTEYARATDEDKVQLVEKVVSRVRSKVRSDMAGEILLRKQGIEIDDPQLKKAWNKVMMEVMKAGEWKEAKEAQRDQIVSAVYERFLKKYMR